MGKAATINPNDLTPKRQARLMSTTRQRGEVVELVPMQFRMQPEFVKAFKQEALDRGWKLNKLLEECFHEFIKESK